MKKLLLAMCIGFSACAAPSPPPDAAVRSSEKSPSDQLMALLDGGISLLRSGKSCEQIAQGLEGQLGQEQEIMQKIQEQERRQPGATQAPHQVEARLKARQADVKSALDPLLARCQGNGKLLGILEGSILGIYVGKREAPPVDLVNATLVPSSGVQSSTIRSYEALGAKLGTDVTLEGKIAKIPYQHMMAYGPDRPNHAYVDLEGGAQIVVYYEKKIECQAGIRVTGKALEISGAGHGGREHRELYVQAVAVTCL